MSKIKNTTIELSIHLSQQEEYSTRSLLKETTSSVLPAAGKAPAKELRKEALAALRDLKESVITRLDALQEEEERAAEEAASESE